MPAPARTLLPRRPDASIGFGNQQPSSLSVPWRRLLLLLLIALFSYCVAFRPMTSAKTPVAKVDVVMRHDSVGHGADDRIHDSVEHQTAFALRLFKRVGADAGDASNVAISPLSIHIASALVAAGANGQTRDQIVSALVGPERDITDLNAFETLIVVPVLADGSDAGGPKVSCANGVFVSESLKLKRGFEEIVVGIYKSEVKAVDFELKADEVAKGINSWAEDATAGLIKDLLPAGSINSGTRLVLVNALYFKGEWSKKFDASETKESEFHLLDGTSTQVPFMTTRKDQFMSSYDGFKVLRLPYAQGRDGRQFSMYVFLPDAADGIGSLQDTISSDPGFLSRHLPVTKVGVGKFMLPKFKISFGFEASAALKELGMALPFSPGDADLSGMVQGDVGLCVSSVQHKCFVEVSEEGTEAAAATSVRVGATAFGPSYMDFEADHPFIFFIREDETGAILFAGHVKNPSPLAA